MPRHVSRAPVSKELGGPAVHYSAQKTTAFEVLNKKGGRAAQRGAGANRAIGGLARTRITCDTALHEISNGPGQGLQRVCVNALRRTFIILPREHRRVLVVDDAVLVRVT